MTLTVTYTEDEVVAAVPRLTRSQLIAFLDAEIILPQPGDTGPVYRQIDIVRLELACDLCEQFGLQDDALGMVLSLVDRLHGVRAELKAVLGALDAEPPEVRDRVCQVLWRARSGD